MNWRVHARYRAGRVVPHVGTWIEIDPVISHLRRCTVVPHVGTWIEMWRGDHIMRRADVVPHVGTWIEIGVNTLYENIVPSCLT